MYITNETDYAQWFKYSYELIIDGYSAGLYVRNVYLYSGSSFSTSDSTIGDLNKNNPGSYRLSASTKTEGSYANSSVVSYATGTVYK